MSDERTPLLQNPSYQSYEDSSNGPHEQFCRLVGVPSSDPPPGAQGSKPRPTSLYERATRQRRSQNITYMVTASLSNTLLLTQVVLGATLTALGGELHFCYFPLCIFDIALAVEFVPCTRL
jgi:hypothetical protein